MKIDITEAERNFSSFVTSLSTFVMNTFASYEDNQQKLVEALKQKEEEISKLKKEIEVTKEQYDIK
jgi:cell shape-determining protein MreC